MPHLRIDLGAMSGAPDRREVDEAITFFFAPPRVDAARYRHGEPQRSVLALVRQEAIDCLVGMWHDEDVVAARPDTYHRLFAAAMVLFAGLDLLAKFFSGSDDSGQTTHRFVTFVQRFMGLTEEDAKTVWQVRNALMHSFGLHDPRANRTLAFHQLCSRPDLSASPV